MAWVGTVLMCAVGYLCAALGLWIAIKATLTFVASPAGHHGDTQQLTAFALGATCAVGFTYGTLRAVGML